MMTKAHGFSLIELSVVLVMISLATAIVMPNLSSAYRSFQNRSQLNEMVMRATSLSYEAYSAGKGIRIESWSDAVDLLRPADGWDIEVVMPINVNANGVCLGGELIFTRDGFSSEVQLVPPYCRSADETRHEK
jgi:prepilin-type N-terminal cleavage/methylation domain-containing protein